MINTNEHSVKAAKRLQRIKSSAKKQTKPFIKLFEALNSDALNRDIRLSHNPSYFYDEVDSLRAYLVEQEQVCSESRINEAMTRIAELNLMVAVKKKENKRIGY